MALYGALELGGTKTLAAVGTSPDDLSDPLRVPTSDPDTTLAAVVEHLRGFDLEAVGIASFGPVELRQTNPAYGSITSTPKPGWSNTDVFGAVADVLGVRVGIDTDVNAAALGEGEWGAAVGLSDFVYITVGTGIGGGAVVGGQSLVAQGHPEMGHMTVLRAPGDSYAGRCPYHGACLEGMACGPALEDRFGPVETRENPAMALGLAANYLAQAVRNIVYLLAPQRVIIGGGVSAMRGFHERVREELIDQLAGYPPVQELAHPGFVTAPGLGDRSGLAGALVLARNALT